MWSLGNTEYTVRKLPHKYYLPYLLGVCSCPIAYMAAEEKRNYFSPWPGVEALYASPFLSPAFMPADVFSDVRQWTLAVDCVFDWCLCCVYWPLIKLHSVLFILTRRDSSVGIATRYGLACPGIESRRGRDFPHLSREALRSTKPPVQWVQSLFPGAKVAEAWC